MKIKIELDKTLFIAIWDDGVLMQEVPASWRNFPGARIFMVSDVNAMVVAVGTDDVEAVAACARGYYS